ncbi:MAG: hypothetical protein JWN67_3671 [Actinomycetia bacterium]|nr:hypothetical protein [Actinomycetes bacterium]
MSSELQITSYDDWMRPQVVALFSRQNSTTEADEHAYIDGFFEHPYQRDRCIRLVALDEDKVVGFQAFFFWPYAAGAETFASYQSGRSLVHPEYRGRGIFQRLLCQVEDNPGDFTADFIVGFPVDVSFGSLVRNGFAHVCDLTTYVRLIHPTSVSPKAAPWSLGFDPTPEVVPAAVAHGQIGRIRSPEFDAWHASFGLAPMYEHFHHGEGAKVLRVDLAYSVRRGRILQVTIGDVVANEQDLQFIHRGMKACLRAIRARREVGLLAIDLNRHSADPTLRDFVRRNRFFDVRQKNNYFLVKALTERPMILDPTRWSLFRSDRDIW